MITVRKVGDNIEVKIDNNVISLTQEQAIILVRRIGTLLGLKISIGKPILSYRRVPGGFSVSIIEGNQGVKTVFVPLMIFESYTAAMRLKKGKYRYHEFMKAVFEEMMKRGVSDVSKYLKYDSETAWKMLFGSRTDYYQFFRIPVLLLQEMGLVEVTRRYIVIK